MKKIILLLTTCSLLLSMFGCSNKPDDIDAEPEKETLAEIVTEETTLAATEETKSEVKYASGADALSIDTTIEYDCGITDVGNFESYFDEMKLSNNYEIVVKNNVYTMTDGLSVMKSEISIENESVSGFARTVMYVNGLDAYCTIQKEGDLLDGDDSENYNCHTVFDSEDAKEDAVSGLMEKYDFSSMKIKFVSYDGQNNIGGFTCDTVTGTVDIDDNGDEETVTAYFNTDGTFNRMIIKSDSIEGEYRVVTNLDKPDYSSVEVTEVIKPVYNFKAGKER